MPTSTEEEITKGQRTFTIFAKERERERENNACAPRVSREAQASVK